MLLDKHNKIIGISRDDWKKIFSDRLANFLKERDNFETKKWISENNQRV